ncbi:succinate dehydrogenase subunit C [Cyclonatronum proteinivorum]|uniref:Succinate dehydrogenase subunit C n=1 Tax=Cyclonatronum proteinivorum TaxID=1457365 RepID=A0A345UI75_9BACT|nr:succinate dehydrogenase cytochrome b subunit [Cyclonatronum proteinivorum]AXJ00177.1 succinate dehydrogenase subunit C [Cyclonatronum proteinivorum]
MASFSNLLQTTVGRKILTGVTGIFLTLFLVAHLAGNLSLFAGDGGEAFNLYAVFLHDLGPLLWIAEIILIILFALHAYLGIKIYLGKKKARPVDYSYYKSQGGPSKQNLASKTMLISGSVILLFVILHVLHFKYNFFMPQMTVANPGGGEMIDLAGHVEQAFLNPWITLAYTAVMLLIGVHLKHGVWSAFISLGAKNPKLVPLLYTVGGIVAALLAVGFLIIPVFIFFNGGLL